MVFHAHRHRSTPHLEDTSANSTEANISDLLENLAAQSADEDDDFLRQLESNASSSSDPPPPLPPIAALVYDVQAEVILSDSVDKVDDSSLPVLVFLLLMCLTYFASYLLKRFDIIVVHETGAALLLGCLFGAFMQYSSDRSFAAVVGDVGEFITLKQALVFHDNFFFLVLLPPIIFDAGFNIVARILKQRFFQNFGAICVYAFLGCFISMITIGFIMFESGQLGLSLEISVLDAMCFGALISATDPVTTLAIFQDVGADLDLYSLIFGESVMNDAISIVLYSSVLSFKKVPFNATNLAAAFASFWVTLLGSVFIGVSIALFLSFIIKHSSLNHVGYEHQEAALVMLAPYLSYMLATCLELSGIVAILFCGVAMARYTVVNVSESAYELVSNFYKLSASVCEMFIFVYMGVAAFTLDLSGKYLRFAFMSLVACFVGRVINVYLCTPLINSWRSASTQIDGRFKKAMTFSGLRGAIAFALSLSAQSDLDSEDTKALLTATVLTVLFTVWVLGGSTPWMVKKLQLRHVEEALGAELSASAEHPNRAIGGVIQLERKLSSYFSPDQTNLKGIRARALAEEPARE
ncbi:hypothetical protein CYMTET_30693 [Cymbomonas tetramitiformis]|uniref:Sodium/hydrogen exchanger n=1 Tax=Cymbomonas tetramitiformis TaxID=36881 RepID=A0AAE0KTY3_9CHLO|nr:hypothetical protein CYMTET_30693 [Cymbomonas tetramitiformis]|eukprot:gene947-1465_t